MITKVISTEVSTGANAGAATSIGSATVVRLFNDTAAVRVVGVSTQVGAATTSYFSMPAGTVEFIQKGSNDVIWTDSAIKANKVAFTAS